MATKSRGKTTLPQALHNAASKTKPRRVLIAGGGSGGHLFPGLAIAGALEAAQPGIAIRFAGSKYGLEHQEVPKRGYHLYRIPVRGLYQVSPARKLWVLAMLPVAFLLSVTILLAYRPHLVIGVGGYASGPILATAWLLRFKTAIQEQNAYPGFTNRVLGKRVTAAFLAVADEHGMFRNPIVTGNPVREGILALRKSKAARQRPKDAPPMLFVFGGSQGARAINKAFTGALPLLDKWARTRGGIPGKSGNSTVLEPLRIVHQTGRFDHEWVSEAYQALPGDASLKAEVVPFMENMAQAYKESLLIVSRAGASAVDEIVTAGRASVLVPIPGTSGDHQLRNAQRLQEAGAAVLLEQKDLTPEALATCITDLLGSPKRMQAMEQATDGLFPGDAAEKVARECLKLMES